MNTEKLFKGVNTSSIDINRLNQLIVELPFSDNLSLKISKVYDSFYKKQKKNIFLKLVFLFSKTK